ncbi:hypothetical protein [Microbacterium sp. NPDC089696]|uniref:hypothetical protein n=1 Tax=Microbacterium sp. NPDC089696 TaxID=3364199 RepID=UPI00382BB61C
MESNIIPDGVSPTPSESPVRDQAIAETTTDASPAIAAAVPVVDPGPVSGPGEPGPKPEVFTTADGIFHAQLSSGELVLKTKVPYKTFKRLTGMSEGDSLADLELFIDEVGIGNSKQIMEDCDDTIQLIVVAAKYFAKFNEIAEARLGESGLSLSS